jgi:cysteinyl-tRNA synthetase
MTGFLACPEGAFSTPVDKDQIIKYVYGNKRMRIYNTMSAQKEEFVPIGDTVRMYVCGVTPYDNSHFGHAMSYVFFDTIRRYLIYRGYKVKYVQNVTDIDDKIINRANQRGITTTELAQKYSQSFFADMDALNILKSDVNPRATEEVPKIIEVITGLIDKGFAYRTPDGSVYFRVTRDEDYGKLSHRTLDMMQAGARIEVGEQKEHPMDFALWKASKPGEPSWDSPWGKGRPGWHIECTAMSMKYLGEQIDIHGGGQDLIFPHHENEIAQSESFTGKKPFVRYWMHNGFLQIGEEKMSKSLGNMLTIKDALIKHSADALRVFILSGQYRSPLSLSDEGMEAAEKGTERLSRAVNREDSAANGTNTFDVETYRKQFIESMDDDFNTAQGLSILFDLARALNQAADSGVNITEGRKLLKELAGDVMGLRLVSSEAKTGSVEAAPFIELLIKTRFNLRQAKQYQMADEIRIKLSELGILLEDTPKGTVWRSKK